MQVSVLVHVTMSGSSIDESMDSDSPEYSESESDKELDTPNNNEKALCMYGDEPAYDETEFHCRRNSLIFI